MRRNIELKMRCVDLPEAHRIAADLGAALDVVERQRDIYVPSRTGRLKLRQAWPDDLASSPAPQARAGPGKRRRGELIWYRRGDEPRPRPSDYIVIAVEDDEALYAVLGEALGVTVEVDKRRAVYLYENVRIHIDDVAGLGGFVEFEAIVDATCDDRAALAKIERLHDAFGSACGQVVDVSYADLVRQA